MSCSIMIVDDHRLFRDGLRALLEEEKEFEVVGEAQDGREAVALARRLHPRVVMMDVSMPGLNGIEATRQIKQGEPAPHVIALSMYADKRFVAEMLNAGASGYLKKDCDIDDVMRAIRAVLSGKNYLCPNSLGTVIRDYVQDAKCQASPLSSREREILQLLAEGKTTKQIAAILKISNKTVDTHRSHIMEKLNIYTIPELTKYAIREGITVLER